jgi:hypothetical protein
MSGPLLTVLGSGVSLAVATVTVSSLLILGNDVVLAAAPATAVQLAHACLAAGYQAVIPASWGDELLAARVLDRLRETTRPVVQCSCPFVARRLAAKETPIAPMLLSMVSPPIATAEYVRALYAPTRPRITFAGGCAAVVHDAIDVWWTADELLNHLVDQGIAVATQATEFDAILPPDRRRFYSEPGGVPSERALRQLPNPVEFHELGVDDVVVELAQRFLANRRELLDVAPALGCRCSGTSAERSPEGARARLRELEPPRSFTPVVDHSVAIDLDGPPPVPMAAAEDPSLSDSAATPPLPLPPHSTPEQTPRSTPSELVTDSDLVAVEALPRRSPTGLTRPVLGTMPHARTDAGRQLPRAYVARRRSSPRSVPRQTASRPVESAKEGTERRRLGWIAIAAGGLAVGLGIAWVIFTF